MKKILCLGIVTVLLFIFSATKVWAGENSSQTVINIKFSLGFGFDVGYLMPDIPKTLQTMPAHPADSPTGSTSTDLEPNLDYEIKISLRTYFISEEETGIYIGLDFSARPGENGYREGYYDTELCDYGGESYAYIEMIPSYFTTTPLIGIQYSGLFAEIGFPYTSLEINTGHDRWGEWDEVNHYAWDGFGQRYTVGVNLYNRMQIGIYYEHYGMEFEGQEVSLNTLGLSTVYYLF